VHEVPPLEDKQVAADSNDRSSFRPTASARVPVRRPPAPGRGPVACDADARAPAFAYGSGQARSRLRRAWASDKARLSRLGAGLALSSSPPCRLET
jgi:hypothetical protein